MPDPSDGRARLVRLTASGAAAYGHGRDVLAFYARALAGRLGASRVASLAAGLTDVLAVLQQWTAEGAPVPSHIPPGSVSVPGPVPRRGARRARRQR